MLSSLRLARAFTCTLPAAGRTVLTKPPQVLQNPIKFRHSTTFRKAKTLKERLLSPPTETPFTIGKGVAIGGSIFGLGSLCYYGLGLSKEVGTYERSMLWPDYVKARIRDTYSYFGMSILAVGGSAYAALRSPPIMRLISSSSPLFFIGFLVAAVAVSHITHQIPYTEGFGAKQCAWLAHCGIIGSILAPMAFLGGPILLRAGLCTAGICGGLSMLAVCAPSEKYLTMAGPLSIGMGLVAASTIGSMFLPPTTAVGAGLNSIMLYGGLVAFSAYLLFSTQRTIRDAERQPHYDPINHSIDLYMSAINIFIRMAMILAGGGSPSKRR